MQAITPWRDRRTRGVVPPRTENDDLMGRLRPLVDTFTDRELERIERGQGPLVYALLDADGLPMSGVICDPETGRHTRFRLPIAGEAVA